ncbi:GntR family transcriptional regulator [Oryzifoliimicrobium ureilyticus]|uniref:GntR family transcriptional regulator n=1 Tax=Oryzifoliimicrobium ureilyticus TaxID=3113724 RepID=UPI003076725A
MSKQDENLTLPHRLAQSIRNQLIAGVLKPGQKLSEASLADSFNVSRNSLREAFRLLTKDGLLRYEPNRGVFVAVPDIASIIDIYRVRRMIECKALEDGHPKHPALAKMRRAVEKAFACRDEGNWIGVGSANMEFHAAIVELADSSRLDAFYAQIAAELRLSFGLLDNPELLHSPYLDLNREIVGLLEAGRPKDAARMLSDYLDRSERTVLAAFSRTVQAQA